MLKTKKLRRFSIALVLLFVSFWALLFFSPKPPLLNGISFSTAVYDNQQHLLRLTLSQDEQYRLFTPLSSLPPKLLTATLLQEDHYFYWHWGINPIATIKAIWQTYIIKSRRIGASTITMQVARMRYQLNTKTLAGKCWQIIYALRLEMHYSKQQILEAYLNLAPYGHNIEGVGTASLIYFNKNVNQLTLPEMLTLTVIPQNPIQRAPHNHQLQQARQKLFLRWTANYPHDRTLKANIDLPIQMQSLDKLPFLAPHFVNSELMVTNDREIITTLDYSLQKIIEQTARRYLLSKKNLGLYNTAILLIDSRDMSVKALLGSADFFNQTISGQIDGTAIKRSPGSTLKPFIYALALDQGLIHPATVLKDIPRSFGSYTPDNFDYDFVGPIKAQDALVLSRNIPAIYLADQLNHPRLYTFLEEAHVSDLKPETYYGLALVLGGAPLTMRELATLYATLLNDGTWYPLRTRATTPFTKGKQLLSPEASFLVINMLQGTPPLDSYQQKLPLPVAWKTGTSSGYRDAWSVGLFGPYVLIVWVGNFDNSSNAAFVGREAAAPLLFAMIDAIQKQTAVPAYTKNPAHLNLIKIPVCKASGLLPTRYCQDTELTWFIPGKSPIKTDTIYREIAIDDKTGYRACVIGPHTHFAIYEFWSSDLLRIFKQAGIARRLPPPYDPKCAAPLTTTGMSPILTSPQTELSYVIHQDAKQAATIPFAATVDADVHQLYWFINANFLGSSERDQPFLWAAKPGHFVVRVVDDHGRADAIDLIVKSEN